MTSVEAPGPEATPDSAAPGATPEALRAEIDAAKAQLTEAQDRYLRARAESDNVRRRAETEVANAHKYAVERFALEMLAVKDSLERARVVDLPAGGAVEKMFEGIDLTLKLMESIFQKFALTPVDPAKGDKFDPQRHQAMSLVPTAEVPPQHVFSTLQKGYLLSDRLLRPALVVVGKAAEGA